MSRISRPAVKHLASGQSTRVEGRKAGGPEKGRAHPSPPAWGAPPRPLPAETARDLWAVGAREPGGEIRKAVDGKAQGIDFSGTFFDFFPWYKTAVGDKAHQETPRIATAIRALARPANRRHCDGG